jgi:hypothetical protein
MQLVTGDVRFHLSLFPPHAHSREVHGLKAVFCCSFYVVSSVLGIHSIIVRPFGDDLRSPFIIPVYQQMFAERG